MCLQVLDCSSASEGARLDDGVGNTLVQSQESIIPCWYPHMATKAESAGATMGLPGSRMLLLATALAAVFLVRVAEQFPASHIADIQGGVFASADEASWINTLYTMASFAGIVLSGLLLRAFGLANYLCVTSALFAIASAFGGMTSSLGTLMVLRGIQGFAAGGFGPAAFFAIFSIAGGSRLPLAAAVLASFLLLPANLGPVIAPFIEGMSGWRALFWAQAAIGTVIVIASLFSVSRQAPNWSAFHTDWTAQILLALALALLTLTFSQGTRRFWFESGWIVQSALGSLAALAGFMFLARFSPLPIMQPSLLFTRVFGISNALNLLMRAMLVVTSLLVPQYLFVIHGYRPLEVAGLMLWGLVPQLLALPLIWYLMHVLDSRVIMVLGFVLCAGAAVVAFNGTSLSAAEELRPTVALFAVGQALFLLPAVVMGSLILKPAELPTASLAFNATTIGGSVIGAGMVSHLIVEREKFHSNTLTESISAFDWADTQKLVSLSDVLASRVPDADQAAAQAASLLAAAARREAWALAYHDAFFVVALLLCVGMFGVLAIARLPRLSSAPRQVPASQP